MPNTRQNVDRRGIALLSLGHASVDLANGAVPALLPFFILERGYSYAQITALILALTIGSSFLQPLFGYLADSRSTPLLMPGGMFLAAGAVALVGLFEAYWITFLLVCLVGIGVAAYHPEAARYANYVSGRLRARGMSFFSVGGNTGFAFGPILVTPLVLTFGLGGTAWLLLPIGAVAVLILLRLPYLRRFEPERAERPRFTQPARGHESAQPVGGHAEGPQDADRWGPFWLLAAVAGLRSTVHFGMQAFIPAYFIATFAATVGEANAALTALLICGAIGTLVGAWIADRVGLKRFMFICLAFLTPLTLAVLISGQGLAYVLVALIGFFTVATFAPSVVLGQQLLPSRIGVASGVTIGASIGVGGVAAAALGPVADSAGLETAIVIVALLPLPALVLTLLLPGRRSPWRRPEAAARAAEPAGDAVTG